MPRRKRSFGRSSDRSFRAGANRSRSRHPEGAQPSPVSYWPSSWDDTQDPTGVPAYWRLPEPLPFFKSSIPQGQVLRLFPRALGDKPKARPFIRWRVQLPPLSLTCIRRAIRRRVLHALRIAGRKGVGAGRPRRTNLNSQVSC